MLSLRSISLHRAMSMFLKRQHEALMARAFDKIDFPIPIVKTLLHSSIQ